MPTLLLWTGSVSARAPGTSQSDILAELGIPVTKGAAPGYVPDEACGTCHAELYESYQSVGMARSFFRPRPDRDIEDLDRLFSHAASGRHYQLRRVGDQLLFKRWELDSEGQPIHVFEQPVDWVLGSGNKSRTYLYQTARGELFQLPLAWYTETRSWGMAPGYDSADHQGVLRRVSRECMFCHNAYPEVEAGSDQHRQDQVFPRDLPQGAGCQRCHGAGAKHLRAAFADSPSEEAIRSSIVNPARLAAALRDDVCNACHLQPSVALFGVRRFGQGDYSHRPGMPLSEYLVQLDVDEERRSRGERFEINHHAYRLRQSRCFEASAGELSCLTCHDPHRKVAPAKRAEHFRRACLSCHADAPGLREVHSSVEALVEDPERTDCVSCHMSKRRPTDVVQVVMTDHRITRFPASEKALRPLPETTPVLIDAEVMEAKEFSSREADLYRTLAVLRVGGGADAVEHLDGLLSGRAMEHYEPWLDLARGQLLHGKATESVRTLRRILERWPKLTPAREFLASALAQSGRVEEAVEQSQRLLGVEPDAPEVHFNLGLFLLSQERQEAALEHFRKAVQSRPNLTRGWFYLGESLEKADRLDEAVAAYRIALESDPRNLRAYLSLATGLLEAGRREEALRYLRHARAKFPESAALSELLERAASVE